MKPISVFLIWTGTCLAAAVLLFPFGTVIALFVFIWRLTKLFKALNNVKMGGVTFGEYKTMSSEDRQAYKELNKEDLQERIKAQKEKMAKAKAEKESKKNIK